MIDEQFPREVFLKALLQLPAQRNLRHEIENIFSRIYGLLRKLCVDFRLS